MGPRDWRFKIARFTMVLTLVAGAASLIWAMIIEEIPRWSGGAAIMLLVMVGTIGDLLIDIALTLTANQQRKDPS